MIEWVSASPQVVGVELVQADSGHKWCGSGHPRLLAVSFVNSIRP